MDYEQQTAGLFAPSQEHIASVKVFPLIPSLKKDVTNSINSPLSWDQLIASDINFSVVRPLVFRYARLKNMAIVYACLVVRSYFLAQSETDLAYAGLMHSRASLCEILAMKLLSVFASNHIQLVAVLTTSWNPLAGATPAVLEEIKSILRGRDNDIDDPQSAIEMAIFTHAKAFISSPVTQSVVNDMYTGRIVFSMAAHRSILADNYKSREIEIYNAQNAPFLDHYRLRVPKYGTILEFVNFALLLLTFVLCLANKEETKSTKWEIAFVIFASAFTLEEYTAATEHGWIIYIANMWNAFDFSFIVIFLVYIVLRMQGLFQDNTASSAMSFDILACGACILFPRLAFFAISDNVVILSLRAMITEFVLFIGIAAVCFSGLLFTLWTLARDLPVERDPWTLKSIAWLMTQIWFGNTSLSFAQATSFHPLFGPILMTIFAALSNTLLLTILISILSNTVANINTNATQEYLFQFAISTIEGVKSDALFSYQPPFNILAFVILKPCSWILTPRALHTLNVFLIKVTSFPQLLVIGFYERHLALGRKLRETGKDAAQSLFNSLPRHIKNIPLVEAIVGSSSSDLYDAIFDVDITEDFDIFDDSDVDVPALRSLHSRENISTTSSPVRRNRKRPTSLGRMGTPSDRSPRPRLLSSLTPVDPATSAEVAGSSRSPLARLFNPRISTDSHTMAAATDAGIKKIEAVLEDLRDLPVNRLKDEMKELQDRQARIENLLLMLTRGMRNEIHRSETL